MTRQTSTANRLFDRFCIVDWSAANTPKRGADSIWIADSHGPTINPATRDEAMAHMNAVIRDCIFHDARLLVGWDFAFGYPAGFAKTLGLHDWTEVWSYLHAAVEDGPDNRSNRFEVAAALNRQLGPEPGPFWGHVGRDGPKGLSAKRYENGRTDWPYEAFAYLREAEHRRPSASPVFKLAYTGSVGSQALLGMARLEELRRAYPDQIAVWPFETDFASNLSAPVILAEIYPSAHAVPDGPEPKDQRQVEAVLRDFLVWNTDGRLVEGLAAPSLTGTAREAARREEGWIVGL